MNGRIISKFYFQDYNRNSISRFSAKHFIFTLSPFFIPRKTHRVKYKKLLLFWLKEVHCLANTWSEIWICNVRALANVDVSVASVFDLIALKIGCSLVTRRVGNAACTRIGRSLRVAWTRNSTRLKETVLNDDIFM